MEESTESSGIPEKRQPNGEETQSEHEAAAGSRAPRVVAVTGLATFLGGGVAQRLCDRPDPPRVLGLDLHQPPRLSGAIDYQRFDLTRPTAGDRAAALLADANVDCVVHTAFRRFPTADHDYDHELETLGTLHLLSGCVKAGVRHFVLASSTMLYGPRPDNPHFLDEARPLHGHPDAHCVQNRVEAEHLVHEFADRNPQMTVTVLRPCWLMGPKVFDHVVEYFEDERITSVLGYDPLLQFVHENDALDAFERAIVERVAGIFNVVGAGVLPLSTLLALGGKASRPLPMPLLRRLALVGERRNRGDRPDGFYDYLRYLWVADGQKAWKAFGEPRYSTREAWMAFVGARRMRRYR